MNHLPVDEQERHIEETRRSLVRTLRDLEFRLSPRQQAGVAWRMAKEGTTRSVRGSARWAAARPVPAVLLVLGIVGVAYVAILRSRRASR